MKKIIISAICIIAITLIFVNTTQAKTYKSFDVFTSSNNNYTIELSCITSSKFAYAMDAENNMSYSGKSLGRFMIMAQVKYKDDYVTGTTKWKDPKYIIANGIQTVGLVFTDDVHNKKITFNLCINGEDVIKRRIIGGYNNGSVIISGTPPKSMIDSIKSMEFKSSTGKIVKGKVTLSDYSNLKSGMNDITWTFDPNNSDYESKAGIIKIKMQR